MKHIELIENIYKDLKETLTKNQIQAVIHLAECYGMLPPAYDLKIDNKFACQVNEWEPEDETK